MKFVGDDPNQGVLHIRTPALMTRLLNREADTKKRLIDGWYDTGDVMRRDENGFVFFVGRADDMFQCGGENVYPGEVEKLLGRHPDVAQVCVVPVADEIKYQLPVASWCQARRARRARTRCAASRSTTARPTPIRARYGSSTSCRWPAPTRSTARPWSSARPQLTRERTGGGSDQEFGGEADLLHDRAPAVVALLERAGEFLGRRRHRLEAHHGQAVDHVLLGERGAQRGVGL